MKTTTKYILFLILFLLFTQNLNAYNYGYPKDMPSGLPKKIEGNYRVIEHNAQKNIWYAYDLNKLEKDNEGIILKTPFIVYKNLYNTGWVKTVETEYSIHNFFVEQFVYIVKKDNELNSKQIKKNKVKLDLASALKKIRENNREKLFTFKTIENFKDNNGKIGDIICVKSKHNTHFIGIWYLINGRLYNVNGTAKNITPQFELTYDVSLNSLLKICNAILNNINSN